jgi:ABC-type Fe3+ transport system permease subunit
MDWTGGGAVWGTDSLWPSWDPGCNDFRLFPFVVRSVQPVLREVDVELEEAAWCLGASPLDTFRRVLFPSASIDLGGVTLSFLEPSASMARS